MDDERDLIPEDERVLKAPRYICTWCWQMVESELIANPSSSTPICQPCVKRRAEDRIFRPHEDWQQERDYPDGSRTLGRGREVTGKYNGRR